MKKSIKKIDKILCSRVGHILITFMLVIENKPKAFHDTELMPMNFKRFLKKMEVLQ